MQYVHRLQDLNPKSIDIESIPLIRAIRQGAQYPLSEQVLEKAFNPFYVSEEDIQAIQESVPIIDPTLGKIQEVLAANDPTFESVNLIRTYQILQELPDPLQANIAFLKDILEFQKSFVQQLTPVMNKIPQAKNDDEKYVLQGALSQVFGVLLKSDALMFNSKEMINESHISHMKGLIESLEKGYLYHFTVGEELKKADFSSVKLRLATEKIQIGDSIYRDALNVRKGVDHAYNTNMKLVHLSIHLFSYIKWLSSK